MRIINKYMLPLLILVSFTVSSQQRNTAGPVTGEETKTIFFIDENNGSAVDESGKVLYSTTDGGLSWVNRHSPAPWQIREIRINSIEDKKSSKKKLNPRSGGSKDDFGSGFMPADDFAATEVSLVGIKFSLLNPGFVSIKIYDSQGKTVDELARSSFGAGSHDIKWNVSKFPGDVYYYSIVSNEFSETNKITTSK